MTSVLSAAIAGVILFGGGLCTGLTIAIWGVQQLILNPTFPGAVKVAEFIRRAIPYENRVNQAANEIAHFHEAHCAGEQVTRIVCGGMTPVHIYVSRNSECQRELATWGTTKELQDL